MNKNLAKFLIIAGLLLVVMNFWAANFQVNQVNYFSLSSNILIVILGFIQLRKKEKDEN